MDRNILIRGARQLLTLNGPSGPRRGESMNSLGLIQDGAVLIIDGVISAVGPTRRVENLADAKHARDINAAGHVVMPAFVDSHAHVIGGHSLVDHDAPEFLSADLFEAERPRRSLTLTSQVRTTPAKTIEHRARKLLAECARHGTTTMEAASGYGLDENSELKLLRVIGNLQESVTVIPTFYVPSGFPSDRFPHRREYLEWLIDAVLTPVRARKLARFLDIESNGLEGEVDEIRRLLATAGAIGLQGKLQTNGSSTATVRAGIDAGVTSFGGLQNINEKNAGLIASSGALATLLPGDALNSAGSTVPARMLIDKGVPIALASGLHHGRATSYNMQSMLSLACSQWKMTTAEAVTSATLNAAYAVGEATRTGSLSFGKDADLLIMGTSDYREISYYFGVNQVKLTMKRGEIMYQDPGFRA